MVRPSLPSVRAAHTFAEAAAVAAALSVVDVAVASDTAAEADSATADEVTLEVLAEKLVDAACGNHSVHVIRISLVRGLRWRSFPSTRPRLSMPRSMQKL